MARNPANDATYRLGESDILTFDPILEGELRLFSVVSNDLDFNIELNGVWAVGQVFSGRFTDIAPTLNGDIYVEYVKSNWIKWSKIGQFDFTIDKSNLAGEMPMDWKGEVLRIGQLDKHVIVYGTGGVTTLVAADNVFGKKTILRQGVKSKGAVLITDTFHLFITKDGCLWRLSDKLENLGYEEYFASLNNLVFSYDAVNELAYVCNGTVGYVFNCKDLSLGQGPINITGIGYHSGNSYFMASDSLASLGFEITIDTMDFMNRSFKTIREVEVGFDSDRSFQLGISFKVGAGTSFTGPVWFNLTPEGKAFPNCWGKDFRLHLKTPTPDSFKISYINVKGQFADYNPIDA